MGKGYKGKTKTTERDKEKFVREEKWELLYGTQLAVRVKMFPWAKEK